MRTRPAVAALWLAAAALAVAGASCRPRDTQPKVVLNGRTLTVEVADTEGRRAAGLSNRRSLPEDHGMLFIFQGPQNLQFHMKDCYFPIDIAFLDTDGRIVNLETMAVEADPANPRRIYRSDRPARYALEAAAGTWQRIGAQPGMKAEFVGLAGTR